MNKKTKKTRNKSVKIISLFSGAMGLDLGLQRAGFRVALAIECDPIAIQTINKNKPRLTVIPERIETVSSSSIRKAANLRSDDIVVVVGGPSCQAFSTVGHRRSLGDPRGTMFREFIRVVHDLKPEYFVMENVRGLLSAAVKHRPLAERGPGNTRLSKSEQLGTAFARVAADFKKLGYYVSFDLLNAADYGVPQSRERLFFVGSRDGRRINFPRPTHSKDGQSGLPKWRTLNEAIGNLKNVRHEFISFTSRKIRLLRRVPEGGNWRSLPKSSQPSAIGGAYRSWGGRSGFLRRLAMNKASPSLVTAPNGNATCLCHPKRDRPLSVQEYARIQQFPDDWLFCGSTRQKYRQIGNAVPVGLGAAIGEAINRSLLEKPRKKALGTVECMNVELIKKLNHSRRTYVNPPRMRKKKQTSALTRWLHGTSRTRKETLAYASPEVRLLLKKIMNQTKVSLALSIMAI